MIESVGAIPGLGAGLLCGYVALLLLAFFGQRALIYPAPRQVREPRLAGARLLGIPLDSGGEVFVLHAPAPPGAPTVAYFHGNGEQLDSVVGVLSALRHRGLGVLAIEYPGYGLAADRKASERRLYAESESALRFAEHHLGVTPAETVLWGHSLGSGVAVEMARRGRGSRLVLLSPFTSLVAMARRLAPFLPAKLLLRDRYDSLAKAPHVSIPALVVHGETDRFIPLGMGRKLAAALPSGRFEAVEGAGHDDLFTVGGAPLLDRLARFARFGPVAG